MVEYNRSVASAIYVFTSKNSRSISNVYVQIWVIIIAPPDLPEIVAIITIRIAIIAWREWSGWVLCLAGHVLLDSLG